MKSNWLFGSVLIFCTLFSIYGQCHAQQYSSEFQALLNQIQQNYLSPRGDNLSSMRNQYPSIVAALVGHALRQQMIHVQKNPALNNQFRNLQQEARAYITDVARTTSYRGRNEDGSPLTPESLWFVVNKVFQGHEDNWILQNFGVRTGTMPSVLAASPGPQPPGPSVGRPPTKREEKNQIELLGKVAPPVKGPDNCDDLRFYFSDQCKWYRQQKEAQAEAARQKSKALNPNGITGNWSGNLGRTQLRIWKQGDLYLGMMSGKSGNFDYSFNPNEVCLRLKSAGAGPDGPIFKGQYLRSHSADGSLSWEDTTFYYYLSLGKENFSNGPSGSARSTHFKR